MQEQPRRTGFSGPKLIRLLARLTDADVPESGQSLSDRLSQWLGWTDAIALSAALSSPPQAAQAGAKPAGDIEEREYARVRTALENAITGKKPAGPSRQRAQSRANAQEDSTASTTVDYSTYRERCHYLQQTMETNIASLRARLRKTLASATPEMARLAAVDAVMEHALSARERNLLAGVPGLLEAHFQRLRQAEQTALIAAASAASPAVSPGAWLEVFRKDMQSVLLAELDIRLQPIEGLLAALRAC